MFKHKNDQIIFKNTIKNNKYNVQKAEKVNFVTKYMYFQWDSN